MFFGHGITRRTKVKPSEFLRRENDPFDHISSAFRLRTLWQNTFGTEYFNGFTQQNYPMLIGIRRETPDASDWFAPLIYRFDQLAKADEITRTHQKISQPLLLQELNRFKSSFDAVEQASVCRKTKEEIFIFDIYFSPTVS